jgi:hypothetical protein
MTTSPMDDCKTRSSEDWRINDAGDSREDAHSIGEWHLGVAFGVIIIDMMASTSSPRSESSEDVRTVSPVNARESSSEDSGLGL